jgi:WD40 repeat protein
MPILKLVAAGSLDKMITIWNFEKRLLMFTIDDLMGGIHTLRFSQSFNRLIIAGFNNQPRIYRITPNYLDYTLDGFLVGHN